MHSETASGWYRSPRQRTPPHPGEGPARSRVPVCISLRAIFDSLQRNAVGLPHISRHVGQPSVDFVGRHTGMHTWDTQPCVHACMGTWVYTTKGKFSKLWDAVIYLFCSKPVPKRPTHPGEPSTGDSAVRGVYLSVPVLQSSRTQASLEGGHSNHHIPVALTTPTAWQAGTRAQCPHSQGATRMSCTRDIHCRRYFTDGGTRVGSALGWARGQMANMSAAEAGLLCAWHN